MGLDYSLSEYLFKLEGYNWSLKDDFVLQTLIHKFGKYTSIAFYIVIVLSYLLTFFKLSLSEKLQPYKTGLLYLLVSTLVATLTISILKAVTNIDCPWSVSGLGGDNTYHHWIELLFIKHEGGRCFPSGHASAAFAFFSLFFFSKLYFPKYSWGVLLAVLLSGFIFGGAQQLRGAHFISHDLTTLILCWIINLVFFYIFFNNKKCSGKVL